MVAVDALPAMLEGARRRVPTATFVVGDAFDVEVGGGFDHVVLSFVLHNLDRDGRRRLLGQAVGRLGAEGRIGILEWASPAGWRAGPWRRFLRTLEPNPAVEDLLDGGLVDDLAATGLRIEHRRPVAGGRAEVVVALV